MIKVLVIDVTNICTTQSIYFGLMYVQLLNVLCWNLTLKMRKVMAKTTKVSLATHKNTIQSIFMKIRIYKVVFCYSWHFKISLTSKVHFRWHHFSFKDDLFCHHT